MCLMLMQRKSNYIDHSKGNVGDKRVSGMSIVFPLLSFPPSMHRSTPIPWHPSIPSHSSHPINHPNNYYTKLSYSIRFHSHPPIRLIFSYNNIPQHPEKLRGDPRLFSKKKDRFLFFEGQTLLCRSQPNYNPNYAPTALLCNVRIYSTFQIFSSPLCLFCFA